MNLYENDIGAMKITMPAAVDGNGIKLFCKGFMIAGYGPNGDDVFRAGVYNAAGEVIVESGDLVAKKGSGGTAGSWGYYLGMGSLMFGDTAELESGNTYYMGVKQIGTSMVQLASLRFNGNNDMFRAWPGGEMFKGSFWDSSAGSPAWDDEFGSSYGEGRFFYESPAIRHPRH